MRHIRAIIYRLGFRPKRGSIWHSPSLHWQYAFESFGEDFEKAAREELARLYQEERQDTVAYALDDKYMVFRRDGQDRMGRKHFKDSYFVIDLTHDPRAVLILNTYADAVRKENPEFATQLDETAQLIERTLMSPHEANTALGYTPSARATSATVDRVVHMHYRGNYTSYVRDVRLATAVRDKYWP